MTAVIFRLHDIRLGGVIPEGQVEVNCYSKRRDLKFASVRNGSEILRRRSTPSQEGSYDTSEFMANKNPRNFD